MNNKDTQIKIVIQNLSQKVLSVDITDNKDQLHRPERKMRQKYNYIIKTT
jgi:hypothetical protein